MLFGRKKSHKKAAIPNPYDKMIGEDYGIPSESLDDPMWQKYGISHQNILDKLQAMKVDPGDFSETWELVAFMGNIEMIKDYFSSENPLKTRFFSSKPLSALAQVNRMDWTPLCYAAWGGDKEAVQFFLDKIAEKRYTEAAPDEVLKFAQRGGHDELEPILQNALFNPHSQLSD